MKKMKKRLDRKAMCRKCGHSEFNVSTVNIRRVICKNCGEENYL